MTTSDKVEAVRLVVWDLDDTLWQGTLSEVGGIQHVRAHYDVMRELTRRGIMNSLCSRNDFGVVRDILAEQGIWEILIFPSVDWASKGPRLAELVAAIQLRPESVLFIDDNAGNLAEAMAMVPGIQIAAPSIIGELLEDERLKGRADPELSRLSHYKVLEKRSERREIASDNIAFLRSSDIRITLDYDVESNIDRAIELINRTNQLNFTKSRLAEDFAIARQDLMSLVSRYDVKAALVRVQDLYGDHGYCGFYVMQGAQNWAHLLHFCFSCRIMGMGVEHKVYELIGRPHLNISGDVASQIEEPCHVDWIAMGGAEYGASRSNGHLPLGEVRLRGGCDLDAVGHYFTLHAQAVTSETNYIREHLFFRRDCTTNLIGATTGDLTIELVAGLGTQRWEYCSRLFDPIADDGLLIVSMWGDVEVSHYLDRNTGRVIANNLHNLCENGVEIAEREIEQKFATGCFNEKWRQGISSYIKTLKNNFHFMEQLDSKAVTFNTKDLFGRLPRNVVTYFLLPSEFRVAASGDIFPYQAASEYNLMVQTLATDYDHVHLVRTDDHIFSDAERQSGFAHFDRMVYYRIFRHIAGLRGAGSASSASELC